MAGGQPGEGLLGGIVGGELTRLAGVVARQGRAEDDDGRAMYEFYLLGKDGRIREVYVDGRSGEILSAEPDD